jgi:hypothetical protein
MQIRGHQKRKVICEILGRVSFPSCRMATDGVNRWGQSEPAFPPCTLDRLNETIIHVFIPLVSSTFVGGI